jgi:MHS family proline/betaine transporter-like MFS transporter
MRGRSSHPRLHIKRLSVRIRSILSSSVGNILEWYDFGLFAIYSSVFSELFFPNNNPETAIIATLTIFAIGFLCRPIGAILFGIMGDTKGRVKTLRFSILMISLPTLLIGCLPTYATIGIAAPIGLMLIRIWQGISIGGEYSGNIIYLAESAPDKYRATITSLASTGANAGILLATVVGAISHYFFSDATFKEWGWRLPYLLSGILGLLLKTSNARNSCIRTSKKRTSTYGASFKSCS